MRTDFRFLAVDVDGTLLDSGQRLPEAHRAALHRAHEMGMKVCLCTGRSLAEAREVIEQMPFDLDVGIFTFGAIVSALPSGPTLHRTCIEEPLAGRLVAHFAGQGYPVLVLYDPSVAGVDYRYLPGRRGAEAADRWFAMAPATVERMDGWREDRVLPVRIGVIVEPSDVEVVICHLDREFPEGQMKFNSIYAPNYRMHVIECFAPQVNKWYGIRQVADDLGIEPHEIVAVGDDVNDVEMIREAGLGVAMGNASEPVRAVADWFAPTNDENGVAVVVDAIAHGTLRPSPPAAA